MTASAATIGLLAKTGRAIAVTLIGPAASPRLVHRGELLMWSRQDPLTVQPHHAVMHLPWPQALVEVQASERAIERLAVDALRRLLHELEAVCGPITVIGVAGSTGRDPGLIANPHIRAHAAEGQLYRQVLETAAGACGVAAISFSTKSLASAAAARLGLSPEVLATQVQALGKGKVHPWRADERQAACAAWAALAS